MRTNRCVKWGVLGCAGIARKAMIPAILQAGNASLYAIASRGGEKLAQFEELFHPEKSYASYEELLSDPQVEAVYIPLPNSLHREWVIEACKKGKPVLCEKPLAMNAQEVCQIREAAQKYQVPVMEAFAYLHGPMMEQVRQIVQEGEIGRVRYMEANFSFYLDDLSNVRLISSLGGGAAYDLGCYPVSFFREILKEEPVQVQAFCDRGAKSGVDETLLAILKFPSGAKASTYCSFRTNRCTRNLILGEAGQIELPSVFDRGAEKEIRITRGQELETRVVDCSRNYVKQVEQMGRVVLEKEKPLVSLDYSLGNARVIEKLLYQ